MRSPRDVVVGSGLPPSAITVGGPIYVVPQHLPLMSGRIPQDLPVVTATYASFEGDVQEVTGMPVVGQASLRVTNRLLRFAGLPPFVPGAGSTAFVFKGRPYREPSMVTRIRITTPSAGYRVRVVRLSPHSLMRQGRTVSKVDQFVMRGLIANVPFMQPDPRVTYVILVDYPTSTWRHVAHTLPVYHQTEHVDDAFDRIRDVHGNLVW